MGNENGFIWKVLVVIHHVLKTLRLCPHAEITIFRNRKINIAHQAGMKSLENPISLILLFFWQKNLQLFGWSCPLNVNLVVKTYY